MRFAEIKSVGCRWDSEGGYEVYLREPGTYWIRERGTNNKFRSTVVCASSDGALYGPGVGHKDEFEWWGPVPTPDTAARVYKPSNGSEGAGFIERYCRRCVHDGRENCPILMASLVFSGDQYPNLWREDEPGRPMCLCFSESDDLRAAAENGEGGPARSEDSP